MLLLRVAWVGALGPRGCAFVSPWVLAALLLAASAAGPASAEAPAVRPAAEPAAAPAAQRAAESAGAPAAQHAGEPAAQSVAADDVRRIVSLNPSLTAILLALGAGDRIVGIDDYSARQQPSLQGLPRVGGLYNPSLEAVLALEPDLVVLVPSAEQRGFRDRLEQLDVQRLVLDPSRFEDVLSTIDALGRRVGAEAAAQQRIDAIRATQAEVEAAVRGRPVVRTVLVLQRDPLFLIGGGNFIDDMLVSAGAINLGRELAGSYPRVAREWLLAEAPDLLIDTAHDAEPAADFWQRWPSLPAVAASRVVAFPQGLVTLPGPQLDEALLALVEVVHPGALASLRTRSLEKVEAVPAVVDEPRS